MSRTADMDSEEEKEVKTLLKQERREKKEKKEKKRAKRAAEADASASDEEATSTPAKKRKRDILPDELEIDVSLPEPASKKAARKAKKAKLNPTPTTASTGDSNDASASTTTPAPAQEEPGKRSDFGVWIGNLPWSATKESLRQFLIDNAEMKPEQITRVHLPPPTKPVNPAWTTKPLNKGFAYVDFSTELGMYSAIALTETKMDGRALLIKNAKSFEGRPDKPRTEEDTGRGGAAGGGRGNNTKAGHPPNKRVFVGNLSFDVTQDDLQAHYQQCGPVENIHMATFEDSGKCKGYAWVTFSDVEAATNAVQGFIWKNESDFKTKKNKKGVDVDADEDDQEAASKKDKKRKWLLNKLAGRDLRCEFAEDATTRYNKRYGKEKPEGTHEAVEGVNPARWKNFSNDRGGGRGGGGRGGGRGGRGGGRGGREQRSFDPDQKVDPRSIKSGAAHANAPRASAAIVEASGKRTTFE